VLKVIAHWPAVQAELAIRNQCFHEHGCREAIGVAAATSALGIVDTYMSAIAFHVSQLHRAAHPSYYRRKSCPLTYCFSGVYGKAQVIQPGKPSPLTVL
jgi:hypothetical protein